MPPNKLELSTTTSPQFLEKALKSGMANTGAVTLLAMEATCSINKMVPYSPPKEGQNLAECSLH